MKTKFILLFSIVLLMGIASVSFADRDGTMDLKANDKIYSCNCGIECPCDTLSNNPGNCTCGRPMVNATVKGIDGDTARLKADEWNEERPFKTKGNYVCGCPPSCTCNTISQNAGKCTCNVDMKKVR